MTELLSTTQGVLALVLGIVILGVHAVTVLMDGKWTRYLSLFNILLHRVELFLLLFAGAELDEGALFFMISIAVYSVIYYVRYTVTHRKGKTKEVEK